jgi:hypothetical protein
MLKNTFTKLLLSTTIFLIFPCNLLFADVIDKNLEEKKESNKYILLDLMITDNVFMSKNGIEKMKVISKKTEYKYKKVLYDKYEKNPWVGFGLNLFLPSVGSWVSGDFIGASLMDVGLVVGSQMTLYGNANGSVSSKPFEGNLVSNIGHVIVLSSLFYGYISPFIISNTYNRNLYSALSLDINEQVFIPFNKNDSNYLFRQNIITIKF